jgi:hypothetical protein
MNGEDVIHNLGVWLKKHDWEVEAVNVIPLGKKVKIVPRGELGALMAGYPTAADTVLTVLYKKERGFHFFSTPIPVAACLALEFTDGSPVIFVNEKYEDIRFGLKKTLGKHYDEKKIKPMLQ